MTLTLHGRRVRLATRKYEDGRYWQGFVRDRLAESQAGDGNRAVRLTVEAVGRDGAVRRGKIVSPVSPGWG